LPARGRRGAAGRPSAARCGCRPRRRGQRARVPDGNLSRHLSTLEEAGYVKIEKTFDGRKPRTWISATKAGRKALNEEIAALREIIGAVDGEPAPGGLAAPPRVAET
jgi:DNA-binding PadR family transcriptional regulator